MKEELKEAEAELKEARLALKDIRRQILEVEAQLAKETAQLQELIGKLNRLQAKIQTLQNEISEREKQIRGLQERMEELDREWASLTSKLASCNDIVQKSSSFFGLFKSSRTISREGLKIILPSYTTCFKQIIDLLLILLLLNGPIGERQALRSRIEHNRAQHNQCQTRVNTLDNRNHESKTQIDASVEAVADTESNIKVMESSIAFIKNRHLPALVQEKEEAEEQIREVQEKRAQLRAQRQRIRQQEELIEMDVQERTARLAQLTQDLTYLNTEIVQQREVLEKIKYEKQNLSTSVQQLTQEVEAKGRRVLEEDIKLTQADAELSKKSQAKITKDHQLKDLQAQILDNTMELHFSEEDQIRSTQRVDELERFLRDVTEENELLRAIPEVLGQITPQANLNNK